MDIYSVGGGGKPEDNTMMYVMIALVLCCLLCSSSALAWQQGYLCTWFPTVTAFCGSAGEAEGGEEGGEEGGGEGGGGGGGDPSGLLPSDPSVVDPPVVADPPTVADPPASKKKKKQGSTGGSCNTSNRLANTKITGGTMATKTKAKWNDCCSWCTNTSGCNAWTYNNSTKQCQLKKYSTPTSTGSGYISGVRKSKAAPSKKTPSKKTPSKKTGGGSSDMCGSKVQYNKAFASGNNLKDGLKGRWQDCCSWCKSTSGCKAWMWKKDGAKRDHCYMKKSGSMNYVTLAGARAGRK